MLQEAPSSGLKSSVVFLAPGPAVAAVGDPGLGRPEDSDLYTTRGSA
jgi:hypothetical protein